MLILLISFVLLLVIFRVGVSVFENKALNVATMIVSIFMLIIVIISDPADLDKGNLKFVADDNLKPTSIERLYKYIDDKIGGVATNDNIFSKLEELNLNVIGKVRIYDIDETLNGYTVRFTDAGLTRDVEWILYFYKNDNNDILKTLKKDDLISVASSKLNNMTFNEYGKLSTLSFKDCEVGK